MMELKVHASACHHEPMVQTEEIRATFVKRLKEALAKAGIAEWGAGARLAKVTGTTPKAASKWLNGESMPGRSNMAAIAKDLGVSTQWLQFGGNDQERAQDNVILYARLEMALAAFKGDDFEDVTGVSRSVALDWRNRLVHFSDPSVIEHVREMTLPDFDELPEIAPELTSHENVSELIQPHRKAKEYPLISWVAAGCWQESCDNFQPGSADEWLQSTENAGPHGYWLEVKGPSMLPTFAPGIRILVKPENFDIISGKFYIAKLLDTGETTFKQYLRDGGKDYLQPLNSAFPVIPVTEGVQIIGMVIDGKLPPIF